MTTKQPVEHWNNLFRNRILSYARPDLSETVAETRGLARDYEYVHGLVELLDNVPDDFYVQIGILFPEVETGLSNELRQRLIRAEAITEEQREANLVYRASKYDTPAPFAKESGNTTSSRGSAMSGETRKVFTLDSTPDVFFDSLKSRGGQYFVKVNPHGHMLATVRFESHPIAPYVVTGIQVSSTPLPLTPMYDMTIKNSVRTEGFW